MKERRTGVMEIQLAKKGQKNSSCEERGAMKFGLDTVDLVLKTKQFSPWKN